MGAILGIVSALGSLAGVVQLVLNWLNAASLQQEGAQRVAAQVNLTTATVAVKEAQAEVDAPKTQAGVVAALKDGSF